MKKAILILIIIILTAVPCFSKTAPKVDPYPFVSDFIRSMTFYGAAMLSYENACVEVASMEEEENPDLGRIAVKLNPTKQLLGMAKNRLTPYLNFSDPHISTVVAPTIISDLDKVIKAVDNLIGFLNNTGDDPAYDEGIKAVEDLRKGAKLVPPLLYYPKAGKSDVLVFTVTEVERTSLLEQIKNSFGDKVDLYIKQLESGEGNDLIWRQDVSLSALAMLRDTLLSKTHTELNKRMGKYK